MSGPRRLLDLAERRGTPLVFLALALAFFAPFVIRGQVFLAADTLYTHLPWKAYAPQGFRPHNNLITDPVNGIYSAGYNRQLKENRLPLWNPAILGGVPSAGNVSNGHPGRFYPGKMLLHRLFDTPTALNLLLLAHVFLMGCTMYLLLRRWGLGRPGALFGGTAYMFNGHAMVWLEFEFVVTVGAYLPLLLLCMERYRRPDRLAAAAAGALVLGVIGLLGQLQYATYAGIAMGFYLLFLLARSALERRGARDALALAGCFALTVAGGLLISAVELLPMLEIVGESSRVGRSFTFAEFFTTLGRVPWRYFATLVYPDFFGSPVLGMNFVPRLPTQEYMNYNELCLYAGVPTLFGLAAFLLGAGTRVSRFTLAFLAAVVGMICGTVVYYPFFALVPGMDKANPTRLIFLFSFAAAAAGGIGLDAVGRFGPVRRRIFAALCAGLLALAVGLALFGASPSGVAFFDREWVERGGQWGTYAASYLAQIRELGSPVILRPLLVAAAAAALFALSAFFPAGRPGAALRWGIIGLLAFDLISFGRSYNTVVDRRLVYDATPGIRFLQAQPGPFRVALDGSAGLFVNSFAPFGIEEVGGYSSAYPNRVNRLLSYVAAGPSGLAGRGFDRWVILRRPTSPLLDMLNVRYVVTAPEALLPGTRFRPVYRGEVGIWENTAALPRAWAVHRPVVRGELSEALAYMGSGAFDMRGEVVLEREPDASFHEQARTPPAPPRVEILHYSADEIRVRAELGAAGWLVLADTYFPGWRATVGGVETPVLPANAALRAVALPAGSHEVVFRYRPRSVLAGLGLSLAGAALALLAWVVAARRGRRVAGPPA